MDIAPPIAQHQPQVMDRLIAFLRTGSLEEMPNDVILPVYQFDRPEFPPHQVTQAQ